MLQPGERRDLARIIAQMLGMFPAGTSGGTDAKEILAGYVMAVEELPTWAVERACRAFIRGEVEGANRAFRPSSAQLAALAREKAHVVHAEHGDIGRILGATVYREISEEERAANLKRFSELISGTPNPM